MLNWRYLLGLPPWFLKECKRKPIRLRGMIMHCAINMYETKCDRNQDNLICKYSLQPMIQSVLKYT